MTLSRALERLVRDRAEERCEYCLLPAAAIAFPFQIDHVIARKHRGATEAENLALSCFACNLYKGPCVAGLDPKNAKLSRLFHPRRDRWTRHFRLHADGNIEGRTAAGRTTVFVLNMNGLDSVGLRANLIAEEDWIATLVV